MCWAMYLFTDNDFEETKYDCNKPAMYIISVENDSNEYVNVSKWNENKKNIYYIGSSQGCGCGWRNPYIYCETFDDEIKYYLKEINDLEIKISNTNEENMKNELIKNNIKYVEYEIKGFVNSRKSVYKNKIKNCEDSIEELNQQIKDRKDLFNVLSKKTCLNTSSANFNRHILYLGVS
jgi:hypothetical protein